MLDITGAGTQHPMRSHWKLRPGPQSHKNSKQQCKRYRANTVTANSKASATRQTAQQPQPAPPPHRKRRPTPKRRPGRGHRSRGVMGHKRHALISTTSPFSPTPPLDTLPRCPGPIPVCLPERRRSPTFAGDASVNFASNGGASGAVSLSPRCLRHHSHHTRWRSRQSPRLRRRRPQPRQGWGGRPEVRLRMRSASLCHLASAA